MTAFKNNNKSNKSSGHVHPSVDPRVFKKKGSRLDFLCPLCGVSRSITKDFKLSRMNHVQIGVLSFTLMAISYPLFGGAGLIYFPIVFCGFEFWKRLDYKREIPCESCGFDALWYKRDVPTAKRLVHEFWSDKNSKISSIESEEK